MHSGKWRVSNNVNWYKKSQYEVEDFQPRPIPALPKNATPIRDNGKIVEPLPDDPSGLEYTWRVVGSSVEWNRTPSDELKSKVEDHLYRRYGLDNVTHRTY